MGLIHIGTTPDWQTGCAVGKDLAESMIDMLDATGDMDEFPLGHKRLTERTSRFVGIMADKISKFLPTTDAEASLTPEAHNRLSSVIKGAHVFDEMGSLSPGYLDRIYSLACSQQSEVSTAAQTTLAIRESPWN